MRTRTARLDNILPAQGQTTRVIGTAGHVDHGRRALEEAVRAKARVQGEITARKLRDRFGTTRKYIIGLLQHRRAIGVTRRVGDARVLAE